MRYERDGFSVEAAKKKGRPLPDDHWFHDEPPQPRGVEFFYRAYRDLVTCRAPDGPIPWTAGMAYADRRKMPPDLASAFWRVIARMDQAERDWRLECLQRDSK